jgi:hypothetical protein
MRSLGHSLVTPARPETEGDGALPISPKVIGKKKCPRLGLSQENVSHEHYNTLSIGGDKMATAKNVASRYGCKEVEIIADMSLNPLKQYATDSTVFVPTCEEDSQVGATKAKSTS